MDFSPAHIHLVLNHLPIFGVPIALFVLVFGIVRKSSEIKSLGLGLMAAMCLSIVPVYLTGESAEDQIKNQSNVSEEHIEAHEDAGSTAIVVTLIAGVAALGTLLLRRRERAFDLGSLAATIAAIASVGTLVWTGSIGGKISHPELRSGQTASSSEADSD